MIRMIRSSLVSAWILSVLVFALVSGCASDTSNSSSEEETSQEMTSESTVPDSVNTLTDAQRADGWTLLFDGTSITEWRGYQNEGVPDGWVVDNGAMHYTGSEDIGGEDIITTESYDDFDLRLEWKISKGGNSGIMYHVKTDREQPWHTGPEMQVLDDERHRDRFDPTHRAGALYDMIAADSTKKKLKPAGEGWNEVRLLVQDGRATHYLNGRKIVEYPVEGEEWEEMIANSKFADMEGFGVAGEGRICLQDHQDKVWYRDLRIKRLES